MLPFRLVHAAAADVALCSPTAASVWMTCKARTALRSLELRAARVRRGLKLLDTHAPT